MVKDFYFSNFYILNLNKIKKVTSWNDLKNDLIELLLNSIEKNKSIQNLIFGKNYILSFFNKIKEI